MIVVTGSIIDELSIVEARRLVMVSLMSLGPDR
jgi:hypothetical protein